ncbi:inactive protein RESTRICTED TEV MOVEMENT 2 [Quercus suber]|uniref:Inactive protein restricted tev movement 2 n=1 Tax=Quercus suber TaxID=58331 RepID=A0AAW0L036_QUESU|nr:inactive protein RESTRICTED TEV MOVEMENT 2-like [Quercus suber]POE60878.1 inactive protein restricted tev movement 2 [Quercus suber]
MESKSQTDNRVYEEFEAQFEWAIEEGLDTLLVHVPGFRREELKVQITSGGNLRVSGQRSLGKNKWKRFDKEFSIPSNVDTDAISAKYDENIIYVKLPKVIAPAELREEQHSKPHLLGHSKPQQNPKVGDQPKSQNYNFEELERKKAAENKVPPKANVQENAKYVAPQKRTKKEDEASSARGKSEDVSQKTTEKAKEVTSYADGKSSTSTAADDTTNYKFSQRPPEKKKRSTETDIDSNYVSQMDLEKERRGGLEKTGKVSTGTSSEKHETLDLEKKEPMDANKKKSTKTDTERSGGMEKAGKAITSTTNEMHETLDSFKDAAERMYKETARNADGNGRSGLDGYRQVAGGLATEMKKTNTLMNLVVAALLALVFALYLKNALTRSTLVEEQ